MPVRTAEAEWKGTFKDGSGRMRFGGGAFDGAYTAASRFEEGEGTNPEELIAAAHAGCFSMALALNIVKAGLTPDSVHTESRVRMEKTDVGNTIVAIELETEASAEGLDDATLQALADQTKSTCPVSRALAAVPSITVKATLR
jgi:osmotically inducible protein OsmC